MKKNKGITLIALIITIIVLLILAGITIVLMTGKNGVISNAKNAKDKDLIAKEIESIKLAVNDAVIYDKTKLTNIIGEGKEKGYFELGLDCYVGKGKYNIIADTEEDENATIEYGPWKITINESGRIYKVSKTGKIVLSDANTSIDNPPLEPTTITITYDANGGTGEIQNQTVQIGNSVTLSDGTGFERQGYNLVGWMNGDEEYNLSEEISNISEDLTLYAIWDSRLEVNFVYYDTTGNEQTYTQMVEYGSPAIEPTTNDTYKIKDDVKYYFTNWDNDFSNIISNITINANYNTPEILYLYNPDENINIGFTGFTDNTTYLELKASAKIDSGTKNVSKTKSAYSNSKVDMSKYRTLHINMVANQTGTPSSTYGSYATKFGTIASQSDAASNVFSASESESGSSSNSSLWSYSDWATDISSIDNEFIGFYVKATAKSISGYYRGVSLKVYKIWLTH